ncbi:MAG: VOC family protein [Armatimonadia bacterium]
MPRVVHFEIPTESPEKTVAFYEKAFGWQIKKWEGPQDYWLVCTGSGDAMGINGAVMRKTDAYGVRNTIGVEDLDEALRKVEEGGGKIILPASPIEGVGDWALCEDPDGNFFGLIKPHDCGGRACGREGKTPRVVHFEIPSANPEQAADFYRKAFGWEITKWEGQMEYWLVRTGPKEEMGIDGGIMRKSDNYGVRNTVAVDDIDEALRKVEQAGGKIVMPRGTVEGVGELSLCEDPDGNAVGIIQPLPM